MPDCQITQAQLDAINSIARWLAPDEVTTRQSALDVDLLVLAGHAVLPNIEGAFALARDHQLPMVISGGIGHSTQFLSRAIADHSRYHTLNTQGQSEAAMLRDIAVEFWGLLPQMVHVEDASTNSGQNAAFTQRLLTGFPLQPQRMVLVQDPLMQRRTGVTFSHQWRNAAQPVTFLNWPVFVPQLALEEGELRFRENYGEGIWSLDRFLSLLMGEIPRLRDDENGYGPRGKNFIAHVDIPPAVESAFAILQGSTLMAEMTR